MYQKIAKMAESEREELTKIRRDFHRYPETGWLEMRTSAKIAEYLKEKKISHIQDSTNLSDEYTRNRIRHHILPILEQQVNGKAAAHMAETAARISQAEEYLTQQSCLVLGEFRKGKEYYFTEKFFMEPQIIQVYALQQAMEQLAGRRKDLAAVHYEKVLELYEMQTGRRISLPYHMEARRDYEGVRLCRYGEEKSAGMIGEKHKGSDIQNGKTVCGKNISDREWKIRIPGTVTSPLGIFSAEIFLYEGQKIEEKSIRNGWIMINRKESVYSHQTDRRLYGYQCAGEHKEAEPLYD